MRHWKRNENRRLAGALAQLPRDVRMAKRKWFLQQMRWHLREARKRGSNKIWHAGQAGFYKTAAANCYLFQEIIAETLRKFSSKIAENVTTTNPLFQRLKSGSKLR